MRASSVSMGQVCISLDWELEVGQNDDTARQLHERLTWQMLDLLDQQQMPATWGLANPALSAAREAILSSPQRHELAVLGDRTWIGQGTVRSRLEREISRRFAGAQKSGLPARTLLLRHEGEPLDLSLLYASGITAIRGPARLLAETPATPSESRERYGVYHPVQVWQVPAKVQWWHLQWWRFAQRLESACVHGESLHLVLDAARLVKAGSHGVLGMAKVLARIAAYRQSGSLEVATIGDLAARKVSRRITPAARSLLKPAA